MEKLRISEIAGALGVPFAQEGEVLSLCTDSRQVTPGCLFVAIQGENFDGHGFIASALEQGAVCALAHHAGDYPPGRVLMVEDTLRALLQLSAYYRSKYPVKVIGITGSVGKTTTKDMVAAVASSAFETIKTQGNMNNEIGAPKTLLTIDSATQVAVVEMGMTGFGQIRDLAMAARPQIGVITNIGVSHMELLGSRENILKAKLELADCLPQGAPLFLCGDNDLLREVKIPRLRQIFYGIENPDCQICGKIKHSTPFETEFTITWEGESYPAKIPGTGDHLVQNALVAFGVGLELGLPPRQAIEALKNYEPSGMRQKIVEYHGITVVEDCYNASPDSMSAALETLRKFPTNGRRIFVASDMLELGKIALESHYRVGTIAAESGVDILFAWGEMAPEYVRGAQDSGLADARYFEEKARMEEALAQTVRPGDLVWFKASRSMKLEEAVEALYRQV